MIFDARPFMSAAVLTLFTTALSAKTLSIAMVNNGDMVHLKREQGAFLK